MKLYVWSNPYHVNYGSSMVFAVAESLEAAKEQARIGKAYAYNEYNDGSGGKAELGEPTRIVDLPCAEWHKWEE